MLPTHYETKTILIETNEQFDRVRTHAADQDYVRAYYEEMIADSAKMAVLDFFMDLLMDMTLINIEHMKLLGLELTPEQQLNLSKLKIYHDTLASIKLKNATWQIEWIYRLKDDLV